MIEVLEFSKDGTSAINNPLYEALLNNYQFEKQDEFIEQILAQWFLTDYLTIKGQLALTKQMGKDVYKRQEYGCTTPLF